MARQRRSYTREFKIEAVKLVTEQGYSVAEAARSLGLQETLLRSWKLTFEAEGDQVFLVRATSLPSMTKSAASAPRTSASRWSVTS